MCFTAGADRGFWKGAVVVLKCCAKKGTSNSHNYKN